jgi:cytoskeletal protein CcmA (bactofilin family)
MFGLKADRQQGGQAKGARSNGVVPANSASDPGGNGQPQTPSQLPIAKYGTPDWSDKDAVTIISEDIVINGNISAQKPICLEGTVEGDLIGNQVIIGKSGAVTGSILANEVEVHGRVLGSIRSKSVTLFKTAHVEGDILHQGIGIEMGTHYDGRLKWDAGADAQRIPFDPVHAAPKPISAIDQGDRYDPPRHELAVAYNAEATSPHY